MTEDSPVSPVSAVPSESSGPAVSAVPSGSPDSPAPNTPAHSATSADSVSQIFDLPVAAILDAVHRGIVSGRELADEAMSRVRAARRAEQCTPQQLGFALDYVPVTRPAPGPGRTGPLAGLPIPIKDLHPVAGLVCTHGSASLSRLAQDNDEVADVLLGAGATIFGSSATPELGLSCYTEPVGLPNVVNPVLPGRTPGGSSGGAAALVARGIVPAAHATDGGGSIRVPAACCGVVGFKPPHDPSDGNVRSDGFITRTVADARTLTDAIQLPGQQISTPPPPPGEGLSRSLRIGVLTTPLHHDSRTGRILSPEGPVPDPLMLGAVRIAADRLRAAGHTVIPVASPYSVSTIELLRTVLAYRCAHLTDVSSPLSEYFRDLGAGISDQQYQDSVAAMNELPAAVMAVWGDQARADVILSPTIAFPPPAEGAFSALAPSEDFAAQTAWTPWCTLWNLTGWAGLSVPVVRTNLLGPWRGWPVSVHVGAVGSRVEPWELLEVGRSVEKEVDPVPAPYPVAGLVDEADWGGA